MKYSCYSYSYSMVYFEVFSIYKKRQVNKKLIYCPFFVKCYSWGFCP